MKVVSRSSGRSAVAAAAYRSAARIENKRDGLVHDFTRKDGVLHTEIVLPNGVKADWALDRSALWNAAELAEKRSDARVAREFVVALPHELDVQQQVDLTREFAQELANRFGTAVDFAIHRPDGNADVRNVHAHLLMTTRRVHENGLGEKTQIERENKWLLANGMLPTQLQLKEVRQSWERSANAHLALAGHAVRIDHRSHAERGLGLEPTVHMGVHATQMQRRGKDASRLRLEAESAARNAELIREKPAQVLSVITGEKSVFDRYDIARTLHRYIDDDPVEYQNAFAAVMASAALVQLEPERTGEPARYSTREMVRIESGMIGAAERLQKTHSHEVAHRHVEDAIARQDAALDAFSSGRRLSFEQRQAIGHVTGPEGLAVAIGYAGAGKSTMLSAAREAWEAEGYHVHGAALSGKAAEGLEEASGIASRTLMSWEYGWNNERDRLGKNDVLVIDEAGMIGSRQMARFLAEAERGGAKIVLVGDPEQLQAIGAGAPFRAISERSGFAELTEIRRQKSEWQREASVLFATGQTAKALSAYDRHGDIRFSVTREEARAEIVRDYLADCERHPDGTRVALTWRRMDVRSLNEDIRNTLQERGELARGAEAGERAFMTNDGERSFARGDRIVLLENDRDLQVKNGMLGTVGSVRQDRIEVHLDGRASSVSLPVDSYRSFDHGYATTIHKAQGATVDRTFVLASDGMNRHLSYVAMTRHRDEARLYAGRDEFKGMEELAARLSRTGAKETTLDYSRDAAKPREILEEMKVPRPVAADPDRDRKPDRLCIPTSAEEAAERYARIWTAITSEPDLPVLEGQKRELQEAERQLDRAYGGKGVELMQCVRTYDPEAMKVMREQRGRERGRTLVSALERERALQADPHVRADRFIEEWNRLDEKRRELAGRTYNDEGQRKVEQQMRHSTQKLERDGPAAAIVRERSAELGMRTVLPEERLTKALDRHLEQGRGLSMGLGR